MADEQSPTVEIAPTVVISNSDNESENDAGTHSGIVDEPGEVSSHITAEDEPSSETVVIAEIEAGRDVALAEIAASVERDRIELEGERVEAIAETNREYEECLVEIAALRERVETLANLLIPPQPLEAETVTEELPIVPEPDLTQPSTAAPTLETMTEPSVESVEESPVEETTITVRERRYIPI
jgi:hypothetical protein